MKRKRSSFVTIIVQFIGFPRDLGYTRLALRKRYLYAYFTSCLFSLVIPFRSGRLSSEDISTIYKKKYRY